MSLNLRIDIEIDIHEIDFTKNEAFQKNEFPREKKMFLISFIFPLFFRLIGWGQIRGGTTIQPSTQPPKSS